MRSVDGSVSGPTSAPRPSTDPDRTARSTIRDAALGLFAAEGHDAVSVRRIATAAGVSPALVLHHFGSKAGLRAAVDEHAAGAFDVVLAQMDPGSLDEVLSGGGSGSLAEAFVVAFPADSPLPAYLRRLLLADDPAGRTLLARWHAQITALLEQLEAGGVARPSRDPAVRAAFLLVADLATILLAPQLRAVVGVDVLSTDGMTRWADEVTDVYAHGAFRPAPPPPGGES